MKILVTGGAGFIGHHVVRRLKSLGHEVVILDNLTTYGIIEQDAMQALFDERLDSFNGQLYKEDIADFDGSVVTCMKENPELIIHLASYPRAKLVNDDPLKGVPTMTTGLMNMLQGGIVVDAKRFVYVSSSMVYGDWQGGIFENAKCTPGSIYATLKLAGEQITKQMAKKFGFDYTIIRPSAVYGPRDVEDRVMSKFLLRAMRDETLYVHGEREVLDFSYVADVADGIVAAALKDEGANETFNITAGRPEFIADAAHMVCTIVNKGRSEIVGKNKDMPSRGYLHIDKARRLLGYEPQYSIEQGLPIYYDWAKRFYSI